MYYIRQHQNCSLSNSFRIHVYKYNIKNPLFLNKYEKSRQIVAKLTKWNL